MDSALNDSELNEFQVKCFNAPLQPAEIVGVKRVVQERVPEGVNDRGLTLTGFLFLHALFIEKGRLETTWAVLLKFGYNDDIELRKDSLPDLSKKAPDQSVELTSEAVDFLIGIFRLFDSNNDGALQDSELDELFSTAPESPWDEAPYKNSVERNEFGDIRLSGFLAQWDLMTLLDPLKSLAYLIYLGYSNDPKTALRVTRKRTLDIKKQQSDRHVYQCFVFGPKNAGKSTLLSSFVGRPFQNAHGLADNYSYTVNTVDQIRGTKKTLILHEIQEDDVKQFLSSKDSLAACDVAVFVYDSSDEYSLKRASALLIARRGEDTGYGVHAFKDDLDSYSMAIRDSEAICQEMKIDAPIRISAKKREMNNIFWRIVNAAERCHLSVPETEYGRNMKQYRRLVNRSLMFASVGAATAVVVMAAYRAYASRKSHPAS
ncbi:mitochondrial Rho GTPase 2-like [Bidens hawaiensis]|uniref:mitochondrial Rho GTPase 2-like n=1 Tax=Bidens hawaiensis TaxID=980011 RepID=UPI00404B3477